MEIKLDKYIWKLSIIFIVIKYICLDSLEIVTYQMYFKMEIQYTHINIENVKSV